MGEPNGAVMAVLSIELGSRRAVVPRAARQELAAEATVLSAVDEICHGPRERVETGVASRRYFVMANWRAA